MENGTTGEGDANESSTAPEVRPIIDDDDDDNGVEAITSECDNATGDDEEATAAGKHRHRWRRNALPMCVIMAGLFVVQPLPMSTTLYSVYLIDEQEGLSSDQAQIGLLFGIVFGCHMLTGM